MKTGKLLGDDGLCHEGLPYLEQFSPTNKEKRELGQEGLSRSYWGSGLSDMEDLNILREAFTPLRQTIVLFMAAMNSEL